MRIFEPDTEKRSESTQQCTELSLPFAVRFAVSEFVAFVRRFCCGLWCKHFPWLLPLLEHVGWALFVSFDLVKLHRARLRRKVL